MHMGEGLCLPLLQASSWGRSGGSGLLRHAQEGLNLCPHVQNPRRQQSLSVGCDQLGLSGRAHQWTAWEVT